MNPKRPADTVTASSPWRLSPRPLSRTVGGWSLLLLLLGLGSAAPAHADITVDGTNSSAARPYVINGPVSGTITVNSGGVLNIVDGAQISADTSAVVDIGGTVNISGGSISGSTYDGVIAYSAGTVNISGGSISGSRSGVDVQGGTVSVSGGAISGVTGVYVASGTVNISGGTLSSGGAGVDAYSGTVHISGGSISAPYGVYGEGATVTISGCNLHLVGDQLIGTLQDGSLINTRTYLVSPQNLANQDTGAPQITCPATVTAPATSGTCSASIDPGTPTASDGCSTPPIVVGVRSDGKSLTDPYPVGTTTITWTATNVHGSASCDQTITVTATQNPTITAPAALTVSTDPGACTASNVSLGDATAFGNCGAVTVTNNAPAIFPRGTTTVTWTATDAAGNTATATQTVTVNDTQKPTITGPANLTVPATSASGAVVNYPAPTASDNCGAPTVVCTPPSGSTFPVGTTTVSCTATDAAGNQSTSSFTVTVTPSVDLSLTMSASPSPVVTGSNLTYTLVVTNTGAQPAQSAMLTDPLPAGTSFASATPSSSVGTLTTPRKGGSGTVTWNVGTLGGGQSVTLTLMVKVSAKAGSTLTNSASVSSSSAEPNPDPHPDSATVMTPVTAKH